MTDAIRREITETITALRTRSPLIHAITGSASQSLVADGLLASGARPMLTSTAAEAPALVRIADGLLINVGSLDSDATEGIEPTVQAAREHSVPWVLDPAAIGVAPVRTALARRLLAQHPVAVRANASEVLALAEAGRGGRGPDSVCEADAAADAASLLASRHGCVVAVSGRTDLITDGHRVIRISNGRPVLTRVTGTGCLLGGLTAACIAAASDIEGITPFGAVTAATALLTVAAEHAGDLGPGSFRVALLDALAQIDAQRIADQAEVVWG